MGGSRFLLPRPDLYAKILDMDWNILGHEWAVDLLQEHVTRNQVRHAYLFTGPAGVGRRTLALRLAQALNCPNSPAPGAPCLTCHTCTRLERMQHPDLFVVQAEQRGGTLKVDQIREVLHSLSLTPYENRWRVALFLDFEDANASAANALLKTLEEPTAQVLLLLTAESAERLIPTIVSRCETLRLHPLPIEQVEAGLQRRWGLPPEQARLLAHIAGGRPGYAVRLSQDPNLLEQRQAWLEDHHRLLSANRVERFAFAEIIYKDKEAFQDMLVVWLSLWHDVLLVAANSIAPLVNIDHSVEIQALADRFGFQTAYATLEALGRIQTLIPRNVNLRLAAEVLMLDIPK